MNPHAGTLPSNVQHLNTLAGRSGIKPMIRIHPFQTGNLCTTNGEKCLSTEVAAVLLKSVKICRSSVGLNISMLHKQQG